MLDLVCYYWIDSDDMTAYTRSPDGIGLVSIPSLRGKSRDVRADILNAAGPHSNFWVTGVQTDGFAHRRQREDWGC